MASLLGRFLRGGFLLRSLARSLSGIERQLRRQNDTLERILAVYAPDALTVPVAEGRPDLQDTGISYLDPIEASAVMGYVSRTTADTGRAPTEEEILAFLADEKTQSLHARLRERAAAADLDRLGRHG